MARGETLGQRGTYAQWSTSPLGVAAASGHPRCSPSRPGAPGVVASAPETAAQGLTRELCPTSGHIYVPPEQGAVQATCPKAHSRRGDRGVGWLVGCSPSFADCPPRAGQRPLATSGRHVTFLMGTPLPLPPIPGGFSQCAAKCPSRKHSGAFRVLGDAASMDPTVAQTKLLHYPGKNSSNQKFNYTGWKRCKRQFL